VLNDVRGARDGERTNGRRTPLSSFAVFFSFSFFCTAPPLFFLRNDDVVNA